jgi:hypothetical protein
VPRRTRRTIPLPLPWTFGLTWFSYSSLSSTPVLRSAVSHAQTRQPIRDCLPPRRRPMRRTPIPRQITPMRIFASRTAVALRESRVKGAAAHTARRTHRTPLPHIGRVTYVGDTMHAKTSRPSAVRRGSRATRLPVLMSRLSNQWVMCRPPNPICVDCRPGRSRAARCTTRAPARARAGPPPPRERGRSSSDISHRSLAMTPRDADA